VLRKRAPFYNGANLRVCVENSGVLEGAEDVNACVDKNNAMPQEFALVKQTLRI